jgi:DNA-binding LacI/PurR family transcriptional regulator/DNA-binding transcriptional regulator YhcF (GntR family)
MKPFHPLSAVEQLAAHLRGEIIAGTLSHALPGVHKLARELGVSPKTVVAAVAKLEHDGLLKAQGARKKSLIVKPSEKTKPALRVSILLYDLNDRAALYPVELQHQLEAAGHIANFASQTILDLDRNVIRIAEFVDQNRADAWVVFGGPLDVLQWFASQPVPAFACFGRRQEVAIAGAGPDKQPAIRKSVQRLAELGHKRIVMISREERRKPKPGQVEQAFLTELASHGIKIGTYNLPDWEESPEGFKRCLDSLFQVTPPTALFLDEAFFFMIAQQHLARRGIFAPQHVSLISCDPDPTFTWFIPAVTHIYWDPQPVIRRIVRWVGNIESGKLDKTQTVTKAEFMEGATIAAAPKI